MQSCLLIFRKSLDKWIVHEIWTKRFALVVWRWSDPLYPDIFEKHANAGIHLFIQWRARNNTYQVQWGQDHHHHRPTLSQGKRFLASHALEQYLSHAHLFGSKEEIKSQSTWYCKKSSLGLTIQARPGVLGIRVFGVSLTLVYTYFK